MMNENNTYYLIRGRLVGKCEGGCHFLFQDGKWVPDYRHAIMDRLVGFDESEPADSPYRIGNMSVMDEIEMISPETAKEMTGGHL